MLHTIQHLILWGKLRSLNKRYTTLIDQAKMENNPSSRQHVEECFWYETAVLLEQRRRIQSRNSTNHSGKQKSPSLTVFPTTPVTPHSNPETPNFFSQQPPSAMFIVIFSLFGGIALGTGLFWLVAPQLLY